MKKKYNQPTSEVITLNLSGSIAETAGNLQTHSFETNQEMEAKPGNGDDEVIDLEEYEERFNKL